MISAMPIHDGRINLYSFVQGNPPMRTVKYVGGFAPEWNNEVIYVIDWKITGNKARLTYMTSKDQYAPINDIDLPLISETYEVKKPNKSRNWTWNEFSSHWFNKATGQRVSVI